MAEWRRQRQLAPVTARLGCSGLPASAHSPVQVFPFPRIGPAMSRPAALCCVVALLCPAVASAQRAMPSISEGAEGFVRREGFVPILVNADLDRVRLEV